MLFFPLKYFFEKKRQYGCTCIVWCYVLLNVQGPTELGKLQDAQSVKEIKAEITSLKGLLLSRLVKMGKFDMIKHLHLIRFMVTDQGRPKSNAFLFTHLLPGNNFLKLQKLFQFFHRGSLVLRTLHKNRKQLMIREVK